MFKLSIFNRIIYWMNMALALATLLSYLAAYISPITLWPVAFFGLAFPFLIILNLLFSLYWMANLRVHFLISMVVLVIGWNPISKAFQYNNTTSSENESIFTVMSYNVRIFDWYNWSEGKSSPKKILDLCNQQKPDILCFQEFYHAKDGRFISLKEIEQQLDMKRHAEYDAVVERNQFFGVAIFSNYPIIQSGKIKFDHKGTNVAMYADIKVNRDTLRVFNMHLASVHLAHSDYAFLDSLEAKTAEQQLRGGKQIMKRLKNAFIKRAKQAEIIAEEIQKSPYSIIVCGDFNDSPLSYTYRTIANGLMDAFMQSGRGFGVTYAGQFPSFRIDYILHSKELRSQNFETITEKYSDHYPIVTQFKVGD